MFSNRFLPCEANIATIAKLRNMIWVVSKNGTILFSKISCFFTLLYMYLVSVASTNGNNSISKILSKRKEIYSVFMTTAKKNKYICRKRYYKIKFNYSNIDDKI